MYDTEDVKKTITVLMIVMLVIGWALTVKSFFDNRASKKLADRREEIFQKISDESSPLSDKSRLLEERQEIENRFNEKFAFPRLFFFSFIFIFIILAVWTGMMFRKFPHEANKLRKISGIRLTAVLLVFLLNIVFFFLLEYHNISSMSGVLIITAIQWMLIAFAAALTLSDALFNKIFGPKKDKNLIDGAPPPAW